VSLVQAIKLRDGGDVIAEMVGARRVSQETKDPLERRLLNVVEEMAIAAGVRLPKVYVMDEESGINAFAAGYDVSNAVVAVTRGTLEALNRDELQGVVAHEFSHILNGDTWLNIKMMGTLAGIVFIGAIGEFLMRSQRDSDSRDARAAIAIFAVGLALFIIGYVGLFFARLIKAAVSRQREFLADASSVQFTRNPDGIAGALDQIRSSTEGALISNRYAEDMSHMFFGQSIRVWAGGLLDTHPPLAERIKRVHPRFAVADYRKNRAKSEVPASASPEAQFGSAAVSGFAGSESPVNQAGRRSADLGAAWGRSAGESAKLVGALSASKIDYASRLLAQLPGGLRESVRGVEGARAAIVALLLAPKDEVMQQQFEAMKAAGVGGLAERARAAVAFTRRLGPAFHLPVIDLALPAIKAAPEEARKELFNAIQAVINADRRVSLHEFVVLTLVQHQLAPKGKPSTAGNAKLSELRAEAGTVLGLVAHVGKRTDATGERAEELQKAMRAGAKEMGLGDEAPAATLTLQAAAAALEALKALAPMQKALLVKGLFAAASADGTIRVAEAELMRLVGAVLECPLPPLLEEIDPASLAATDAALAMIWASGIPEAFGATTPGSLYLIGALLAALPVLLISAYYVFKLREDGAAIAGLVGAREVTPDTRDALEQRLLHAVEECALAAGVRVPRVFVLDRESGINALTVGLGPPHSVIVVTLGAVRNLNHDELGGLLGHEFVHLMSPDARLHHRMMAILSGVVLVGAYGAWLMRSSRGNSSRRDDSAGGYLIGLALFAIGYPGLALARLVKAAMLRGRESEVDAAAVAFTRSPAGLAGALDQIRVSGSGAAIAGRYAEDLSHMCFSAPLPVALPQLFAMHPPLEERIRRVLPDFGAKEYRAARAAPDTERAPVTAWPVAVVGKRPEDQAHAWPRSIEASVALVGKLDPAALEHVRYLVASLPVQLRDAARSQTQAPGLAAALMLAPLAEVMERQLAAARAAGAPWLADAAPALAPAAVALPSEQRAALVELALPAIAALPAERHAQMLAGLEALIRADRRASYRAYGLLAFLRAQREPAPPGAPSLSSRGAEAVLALSFLAHGGRGAGKDADLAVEIAFGLGVHQLALDAVLAERAALTPATVGGALCALRALAPAEKERLLTALFVMVVRDGKILVSEAMLLRLIAAVLECPLGPFLQEG
jgi:Zn-dependent protease with chaperone function/uncharacterized tellurite resistance protein B-like protein